MSHLQNINLLAEQNNGIFANRKAADLKEGKNGQGAFWPGYEDSNVIQVQPPEEHANVNNKYNQNQLELFTSKGTVIYSRKHKSYENRRYFLNIIFHRNLRNSSTKLLHEQFIECFDVMDEGFNFDYYDVYVRKYLLFNSYIFTVQYESIEYHSENSAYGEKYRHSDTFTILKVIKK